MEIAKALGAFQAEVETIKKDASNPFFKSKYASLENIVEGVRKPLKKNGLSFSQFPTGEDSLTTILMHISGEWMKATVKMNPKEHTPQGQGSAITYMRRYALSAVLGIVTDEDDDGNAASAPTRPTTPVTKPPVAPKAPVNSPKLVLKSKINELVKELGIPNMTKDNAKTIIKSLTDQELIEENYPKIHDRLAALVQERNEQEGRVSAIRHE